MTVVEPRFDELIHAPLRLRICGLLRPVDALAFRTLSETLDLPPTQLSKHLRALSDAGYVSVTKTPSPDRGDARRVAWVGLTRSGRRAFDQHAAMLRQITEVTSGGGYDGDSPVPPHVPGGQRPST